MRGYPHWRWHLDEVFVKVNGRLCYLWRAVDHEGEVFRAYSKVYGLASRLTASWMQASVMKAARVSARLS